MLRCEYVNPIIKYDTVDKVFIYDAKFYLVNGHWCADREGTIICGDLWGKDKKAIEEFLNRRNSKRKKL